MYSEKARELRRCNATTLGGFGQQCRNFSKVNSNLCSIHLAADNREYPDEATKVFNKVVSKRNRIGKKKGQPLRCQCQAYPFVHPAGGGRFCNWPYQPTQRLECKTDSEAASLRRKLRRQGVVVNTIKEKMESGICEDSKIIDLDCDPSDLSMEADYLAKIEYEVDVLSLPIDERRKIQKKRMIAEYLLKIGKADIDGVEPNSGLIEDDSDLVEIDGETYRID
jgi:hypothetical protein